MRLGLLTLLSLSAGCATTRPMAPPSDLFHDELFGAPTETVDPDEALKVSDAMRDYLRLRMGPTRGDRRTQLLSALYDDRELRLEYDAAITRNASQAYAARAGNCLSLVIMTAAFARELGLSVRYQTVYNEESWSRAGGI